MSAKVLLKAHIAKTVALPDDVFDHFFSHFTVISLRKGDVLIQEGDQVAHEYFVVSGCLKSYYTNDDDKMFILQFAMPTWWTTDYNALYNHLRAGIVIDCVADAEVLVLSHVDRERLCEEIHALEYFFRWRTNRGYVAAMKRTLSLMNNDVKFRYEELLATYPALYNLVPKQLIAAYLGVSRETLSRLYANHK